MRSLLAILFFVCVAPLPALAATGSVRPPMDASKCPSGSSTEAPPVRSTSFTSETNQAAAQKFLNTAIYCPNACYDLTATVRLTANYALAVTVTAKNSCSSSTKAPNDAAQSPKRGCAKGEQRPQITITTKDIFSSLAGFNLKNQTLTRSRCDSNAIQSSVSNFFSGLMAHSDSAMQAALNTFGNDQGTTDLSARTSNNLDAALSGDKNASSAILQSFGLTKDQAAAAIENNPDKVNTVLQCLSDQQSCDSTTFSKNIAALGVKLNPDLAQQAMLHPEQFINGNPSGQAPDQGPSSGNTFNQGDQSVSLPAQCGVNGIAGNFMYAESACGRNTYSATTNVVGPYQFLCSTWANYANSTGYGQYASCGYANDVNIATQVVNARTDQFQQQYGSACSTAGLSWSSCAYAIHVFGEGGFRSILSAEQSNPGAPAYALCGSAVSYSACSNNISIFRNGGTVAGVFGELDRRLGSNSPVIPSYYPSSGSPFGTVFTPGNSGYYMPYGGSPIGNAIPVGYAGGQAGYSPLASGSSVASTATQSTSPATPIQYTGPAPTTQPALPAQSVATLIAQPTTTTRGNTVLLSWSSAGMRADVPCAVSMGSTTLAQSNEGTKRIDTNASSPDTLTFSLMCTAVDGTSVQQSASVTLHG